MSKYAVVCFVVGLEGDMGVMVPICMVVVFECEHRGAARLPSYCESLLGHPGTPTVDKLGVVGRFALGGKSRILKSSTSTPISALE